MECRVIGEHHIYIGTHLHGMVVPITAWARTDIYCDLAATSGSNDGIQFRVTQQCAGTMAARNGVLNTNLEICARGFLSHFISY